MESFYQKKLKKRQQINPFNANGADQRHRRVNSNGTDWRHSFSSLVFYRMIVKDVRFGPSEQFLSPDLLIFSEMESCFLYIYNLLRVSFIYSLIDYMISVPSVLQGQSLA